MKCGSTVVKVLCYKSDGCWFDPSWCQWIFHWHKIHPIALWPWGRISLQQKWVPGVFLGGKGDRCVRLATYHHPVPLSRNLGALTSWNPLGLSRPVLGPLYLCLARWSGWSTTRLCRFTPGKGPGNHFTVGWLRPRAGLVEYVKFCPRIFTVSD